MYHRQYSVFCGEDTRTCQYSVVCQYSFAAKCLIFHVHYELDARVVGSPIYYYTATTPRLQTAPDKVRYDAYLALRKICYGRYGPCGRNLPYHWLTPYKSI